MKFIETPLHIGIEKPFSVLHLSDTHLTFADMRDGERKVTLAKNRLKIFKSAEADLKEASLYAKENGLTIIHTGDLIDFVSQKNLEKAKEFTDNNDCFISAGNHEFSLYVGEAKEDEAYRNQSLNKVQAVFKNDIRFSSRIIGGVNFVAVDNSYYLFEERQLSLLKEEVKKGLPVILLMHTPLYSKKLRDFIAEKNSNPVVSLMAVPPNEMTDYPEHRLEQQKADEITREAYDYIINEPTIKGIIAGHIHIDTSFMLTESLIQITTGVSSARIITID